VREIILVREDWPDLAARGWQGSRRTVHLWSQIVGKIRLALMPPLNHYWHVPLYVSARGLTTSAMPYRSELVEIELNFLAHHLDITTSWGAVHSIPLRSTSVAEMYSDVMTGLGALQIDVSISTMPVEIADPVRFELDHVQREYDPPAAQTFWHALMQADRVFTIFRGRFLGKTSPVHFFWGGFDLAVTRFSGRRAPMWTGTALNVNPHVMHESYSHEVSSAGLWLGDDNTPPMFYSYAVPEPIGFRQVAIRDGATYSASFGEFVLPYEAVRSSQDPSGVLLEFLQDTYDAAANLGGWDRVLLEERAACACDVPPGGDQS
jgi:hypothetical protein